MSPSLRAQIAEVCHRDAEALAAVDPEEARRLLAIAEELDDLADAHRDALDVDAMADTVPPPAL